MDAFDPHSLLTLVPLGLATFSTVHTFLDRHPRLQAGLRLAAHIAGPFNLPAMRDGAVLLARAIVKVADEREYPTLYVAGPSGWQEPKPTVAPPPLPEPQSAIPVMVPVQGPTEGDDEFRARMAAYLSAGRP